MGSHAAGKDVQPSLFIDMAAWVLLVLVIQTALLALFSAGGIVPQIVKLPELRVCAYPASVGDLCSEAVSFQSLRYR